MGLMTSLNPWDFVLGLITTFGINEVILAIEFLLDIENLFIDTQDAAMHIFFGTFLATFYTCHKKLFESCIP